MNDKIGNLAQRWTTPAGVMVVLGGVIWGIQLNFAVLELTKNMSKYQTEQEEMRDAFSDLSLSIARTTILQQQMIDRIEKAEQHVDRHEEDWREWKKVIIENRTILNNGFK